MSLRRVVFAVVVIATLTVVFYPRQPKPVVPDVQGDAMGLLGGFKTTNPGENDEGVNKAVEIATAEISKKHKDAQVEVLESSKQVVAGTNYRLKLKVKEDKPVIYEATVFEALPSSGGGFQFKGLKEVQV